MNIGTSKGEVKAFVEQVIKARQDSIGYSIMSSAESKAGRTSFQQEFINGRLYDLYEEAQRSSTMATMKMLMEVLDEYPGFPEYFEMRKKEPNKRTPDLPWCEYVGNPAARRFWGLSSKSC